MLRERVPKVLLAFRRSVIEIGREPSPEMPLLCERFEVVFQPHRGGR